MTSQRRNDSLVNLLRPDFFARAEPNASWVHYQSAIMSTCGLQGFWPMSTVLNTGTHYAMDNACYYPLTAFAYPTFGYLSTATITALPPWVNFASANSQYLEYSADSTQHDIIGTEAYISANERGLTLGGWFKFTTIPASIFGLMSKWHIVTNNAAYSLIKTAANNILFQITTDGSTVVSVTSAGTVALDTWYHLYGRFQPNKELAVFIDNVKTVNAVAVPATIFDSEEPFAIGWYNRANYDNGKASMCHLNASYLSDSIIEALWENSRTMYNK